MITYAKKTLCDKSIPDIGTLIEVEEDATLAIEASLTWGGIARDEAKALNKARGCWHCSGVKEKFWWCIGDARGKISEETW